MMLRVLVLLTWGLFACASLLYRRDHVFMISQVIDVLAFAGFIAAIAFFFMPRRWRYIAVTSAGILVIAYIFRWGFLMQYVASGNPDATMTNAAGRLIDLWGAEFSAHWKRADYISGLLSIYWNVAMPLLQVAVIALLGVSLRKDVSGKAASSIS